MCSLSLEVFVILIQFVDLPIQLVLVPDEAFSLHGEVPNRLHLLDLFQFNLSLYFF